jgi:hypothetical protein
MRQKPDSDKLISQILIGSLLIGYVCIVYVIVIAASAAPFHDPSVVNTRRGEPTCLLLHLSWFSFCPLFDG